MPEFSLPDPAAGTTFHSLDIDTGHIILVMFICNHCPYVIHLADHLSMLAYDYKEKPVSIVAINSNNAEAYPDDSPENMVKEVQTRGYIFPYLYDESQQVSKDFRAACTPDFFVFDRDRTLSYRGQFDSSRPGNQIPVTGENLRAAINSLLENQPVPTDQFPSMGCNIKWKPGNEPDYFH